MNDDETSVAVTRWFLEMTSPGDLRPSRAQPAGALVARADHPLPELNRFFYSAVGGDWYWLDRLGWSYRQWMDYLDREELETWIVSSEGLPAGYAELEFQAQGEAEICYFGLLPRFIGQGLGGYLLTEVVRRAWFRGATRLWLHTCSLDHPAALPSYQKRGFRVFRKEEFVKRLPLAPPGPWPGARRPSEPAG